MSLDRYGDAAALTPEEGEVQTAELVVNDVLEGTVTVLQGEEEDRVQAPGVVFHERGVPHGARNDTEDVVVFTASLAPMPGSG